MQVKDIPNLALLSGRIKGTPSCPRDMHTTSTHDGEVYALQPDFIVQGEASVCNTCWSHLVGLGALPDPILEGTPPPPRSLACIDPGLAPDHLPKLTYAEAHTLSVFRPSCDVYTCTPGHRNHSHPEKALDSDPNPVEWHVGMKGHHVAFDNPDVEAFHSIFPRNPSELDGTFSIVLLAPCKDAAALKSTLERAKQFAVRGDVIYSWVQHLRKLPAFRGVEVNDAHLSAYAGMSGVPDNVVNATFATATHTQSDDAVRRAYGDDIGSANLPRTADGLVDPRNFVGTDGDLMEDSDEELVVVDHEVVLNPRSTPSRLRPRDSP